MSSIHYKFRSLVSYKTINFDTLHVSVEELKRAIFDAESLSPEAFDLVIENSHTKREYSGKDIIPRNSSLVVKRVPRQDAAKLPKIQDTSTSGIVTKGGLASAEVDFMKTEEFSKMSEEQRLEYAKNVSYQKYQPANYQKKAKITPMSDPPPPTYVCNRCHKTGHWVRNCPLATIRRTTGLPIDELVETTADDPAAMLHPATGKFMIQKMHLQARLNSKAKAPLPFLRDSETKAANSEDENPKVDEKPPPELLCPICGELINEAVVMMCCGISYCAECIQNLIIEDPGRTCPGDGCKQTLSVDAMIRNVSLRKAVDNFKKKQQGFISRSKLAAQSPSRIEKVPAQKTAPPVATQAQSIQSKPDTAKTSFIDLPKLPLLSSNNNPLVVLPDLSKPPPSFPAPIIQQQVPVTTIPLSTFNATTSNNLFVPVTRKSISPKHKSASQSPNVESGSVPYEEQECATPPHVQTPPQVEKSPKTADLNLTLPPGAGDLQKTASPKHHEPSEKAIQAFSAFNPSIGLDLLSTLNDDLKPPGVDDAPMLQPISTIDPVTGRLRGSNGKLEESKRRRSPVVVHRRRRRDSRSPVVHRHQRRDSRSPYRRPPPRRERERERPRREREKTPPRKKHENHKRRRDSDDFARSEKRKKRRSRTKSRESEPEEVAKEEFEIDSVLKEITETILPKTETQINDNKDSPESPKSPVESKMEVDEPIERKSSNESSKNDGKAKSPDSDEKASTRKTSATSTSSNNQPAAVSERGFQISMDSVNEEIMKDMMKNEDPMSQMDENKELASPPKEKLSRKHSKKDKKHKRKKHKKDRDGKEKKKKDKKAKKSKKTKKHHSRSHSKSPRRHRSRS
ncbi:hypothetical protein M3Y97_00477300 [Aphelenchoides bicaudatus]|nr:hypothetical protein M3Y97_00477300 [Aphelenchoides bicaudatus]